MNSPAEAGSVVRNRGKKPSSLRYYQDGPPESVDLARWTLEVGGLGIEDLKLSYEELGELPQVEQNRRMVCVCNWSVREVWQGVLLADVLKAAGLKETEGLYLKQISIGTPEKGVYESTMPLGPAFKRDALLCHTLNGSPLPMERGYPLRLLDFGLYGYKNVKGLKRLEVTDEFESGEWERKAGYKKDGTIRPKRYWIVDLVEHKFVGEPGEVKDF